MLQRHGARALLVLFLLSLPAVTTRIYASDEIQYFSFLRSLWFDHDVSFDNEYRYFEDSGIAVRPGFAETYLSESSLTPTHHRKTYATIGCAILWTPFYAIGDATARLLHAIGRPVAVDGYSWPYIWAVCYGSAFYGCAALWLSGVLARRVVGPSAWAVAAIWIGTPLLFYTHLAPVFGHACEAFAVAVLLWVWLRVRARWTVPGAMALGAAAALAGMVREQDLIFAVAPALDFLWAFVQSFAAARPSPNQPASRVPVSPRPASPGACLAAGAAGAATAAIVFLPQAAAYIAINGGLRFSSDVSRKMTWTSPHALGVLADREHGFLFWTPLVVPAVAGLVWLYWHNRGALTMVMRERRALAMCALAMVVLNIYIAGAVESWTAAGAFGQRRFVSLTPVLIVGLTAWGSAAHARGPAARRLAAVIVGLCIWWNLGLMAQFGLHTMDRKQLSLGNNAWQTFVDLPRRAPALAWRYLTDRRSFFQHPGAEEAR